MTSTTTNRHHTDGEVPTASVAAFGDEEEYSSFAHSNDQSPQSDDNSHMQRMIFQSKSLLDDDDDDDEEEASFSKTNDTGISAATTKDALVTSSYSASLPSVLLGTMASSKNDISSSSNNKESDLFSQDPARHNSNDNNNSLSSSTAHTWDGFVRQGTRLKTFLDDAMHKVRDSLTGEKRPLLMPSSSEDEHDKNSEQQGNNDEEQEPARQRRRTESMDHQHHHSAELAREKMTEVMQLQRVRIIPIVVLSRSRMYAYVSVIKTCWKLTITLLVMPRLALLHHTATQRCSGTGLNLESRQFNSSRRNLVHTTTPRPHCGSLAHCRLECSKGSC